MRWSTPILQVVHKWSAEWSRQGRKKAGLFGQVVHKWSRFLQKRAMGGPLVHTLKSGPWTSREICQYLRLGWSTWFWLSWWLGRSCGLIAMRQRQQPDNTACCHRGAHRFHAVLWHQFAVGVVLNCPRTHPAPASNRPDEYHHNISTAYCL